MSKCHIVGNYMSRLKYALLYLAQSIWLVKILNVSLVESCEKYDVWSKALSFSILCRIWVKVPWLIYFLEKNLLSQ